MKDHEASVIKNNKKIPPLPNRKIETRSEKSVHATD
jgi:hypothetical protein